MQFVLNSVLTLVVVILIIGILVFVHELGHFLVAKRLGIVVQEFAFGFGKKLWAKKWHGTLYRINLLPFGGYVLLLGDQDGSSFLRYKAKELKSSERSFVFDLFAENKIDPRKDSYEKVSDFYEAQKKKLDNKDLKKFDNYMAFEYIPNHPGNLDNHRILHRAAVMMAGVIMNMILGSVLFYLYFMLNGFYADFRKLGDPQFLFADSSTTPILYNIYDSAHKDFKGGLVTKVNDQYVYSSVELQKILQSHYNQEVKVLTLSNDNGFNETTAILNGDGYKSNLDSDFGNKVIISEVVKDSAAEKAGLKTDDVIITFADREISNAKQFDDVIKENQGKVVKITVLKLDGTIATLTATLPVVDNNQPILGTSFFDSSYVASNYIRLSYENNKLISGFAHSVNMIYYTIVAGGQLISQSIQQRSFAPVSQGLNSIIVIPDIVYSLVKINDFTSIINLAALVSVSLAFMNILPIPLMDGGHLLFLLIEKKRGKPISIKKQEKIGEITFIILIIFTVVIMIKDVFQIDLPNRIINLLKSLFGG